ncbi:uncharacterized protein B0H18DRAFT_1144240, partial [Fomitopsis serialis]|uniref:uncharacterized protein n=1 Tax=Fomitopsis serialis TaxID=139415 RepID=UPI002007952F
TVDAEPTSHTKRTSRSERAARSHRASHTIRTQRTQRTGLTAQLERELDALEGRIPKSRRRASRRSATGLQLHLLLLPSPQPAPYTPAPPPTRAGTPPDERTLYQQLQHRLRRHAWRDHPVLDVTTVMWCYAELEEIYERPMGYTSPERAPGVVDVAARDVRASAPKLARRYAGSVTAFVRSPVAYGRARGTCVRNGHTARACHWRYTRLPVLYLWMKLCKGKGRRVLIRVRFGLLLGLCAPARWGEDTQVVMDLYSQEQWAVPMIAT